MSVEKVREYLKGYGVADRMQEFTVSSATVELAAVAVGVEPARIAKTLSFKVDETPVLIVAAGDAKVDNSKYKHFFHTKAKMLTHEEAVERLGHAVGGVCPFALPAEVKTYLDDMGIAYEIDTNIVRGLDYYTKTVFEFVSTNIGAQGTICGGGRYDGLISQLGGQATPGMGFGCGLERLIMVMEAVDAPFPEPPKADIYLAPLGDEADRPVQKLVYDLRQLGVSAERDLVGRGLRAQMKHADRIGARFSAVIGDGELESKVLRVKNMETGEQTETELTAEAIAAVVMA